MSILLTMRDETAAGDRSGDLVVDVPDGTMTVRELIRQRVLNEITNRMDADDAVFGGLVRVPDTEAMLNQRGTRHRVGVDPDAQVARACDAFESNRFFLLVDGHQPTELNQQLELSEASEIAFVRLVPLVGG